MGIINTWERYGDMLRLAKRFCFFIYRTYYKLELEKAEFFRVSIVLLLSYFVGIAFMGWASVLESVVLFLAISISIALFPIVFPKDKYHPPQE